MMHKAWSSIEEVPYCFSRSSVKFQGHPALKFVQFDPNWAFPDCNSSLNSPMAMKCCTNLETAKERCPIVFQGHPSNFKVTRDKTSPILTQIGRFGTLGRSQLSNPLDLPCSIILRNQQKIMEPLSLTFLYHNQNSVETLFCSHSNSDEVITTNFAHDMTAVLSWHVQKIVVGYWPDGGLQNFFFYKFVLRTDH